MGTRQARHTDLPTEKDPQLMCIWFVCSIGIWFVLKNMVTKRMVPSGQTQPKMGSAQAA